MSLQLPHPNVELRPKADGYSADELFELAKKLQENLDYIVTHWPK